MASSEPGLENRPVCASGTQVIYGWAMDAKSLRLPGGFGFRRDSQALLSLVELLHYCALIG